MDCREKFTRTRVRHGMLKVVFCSSPFKNRELRVVNRLLSFPIASFISTNTRSENCPSPLLINQYLRKKAQTRMSNFLTKSNGILPLFYFNCCINNLLKQLRPFLCRKLIRILIGAIISHSYVHVNLENS